MAVTTTQTNKPINPRGNDQSQKAFNRASLFSGKALDFDGVNDYVDLDGFTMAGNVATIVFQAKFSNGAYLLDINTQRFVVLNDTTNGLSIYNSNDWTYYGETIRGDIGFYAIVSDGTTQRAYFNGVQLGEDKTIVAIDWDSITEMALGSNNNGTGSFFSGQIAGFKIFNTALTAAQVADLYNNPEKVVPTGVDNTALKLWLPMQEGAGTTAYDGSGNGNHGTISGATYVNGVGAPVAQTAVIDWNKGTNLLENTESIATSGYWYETVTINGGKLDPAGGTNAVEWVSTNPTNHQLFNPITIAGNCVLSCYVKSDEPCAYLGAHSNGYAVYFDLANETISSIVGSGVSGEIETFGDWYKITAYFPAVNTEIHIGFLDAVYTGTSVGPWGISTANGTSGFIAFPSLIEGTTKGAYIPNHTTTAITSPVLLPQGLTSGRDITGVNLFENVRKQGALNLDGNSWAEVHDNASLDITTAISMECWFYYDGSNGKGLLGRWGGVANNYLIYISTNGLGQFYISTSVASNINTSTLTAGNWYHFIGTYDGSDMRIYLNGSEESNASKTGSISTSSDSIKIGKFDQEPTYSNQIAQPRIYNRALTAEEVQRNYNAGKNTYTN